MKKRKLLRDNLILEFEYDIDLMKKQINELEKLREVIKNSPEYKMLDGKTQMIGSYNSVEYQNGAHSRGEHSECVASIAKNIVSGIYKKFCVGIEQKTEVYRLNKKKSELYAEIMGYSHDLGHTPFGHVGESGLNDFMKMVTDPDEKKQLLEHRREIFGNEYEEAQGHSESYNGIISFEHNEQSAKVFYDIVKREGIDENLVDTKKIIWGILGHSTSRVDIEDLPNDICAQAIRVADKIEYINKDYDELKPCLVKPSNSRIAQFVKNSYKARVKKCIENVVDEAFLYGKIDEKMDSLNILNELKEISDECVLLVDVDGKRGLVKDENVERLKLIAYKVAEYYYTHNDKAIYNDTSWEMHPINYGKVTSKLEGYSALGAFPENKVEKVLKFVSSMDNERCDKVYNRLVKNRILYGPGHGIEPITKKEIDNKKEQQLIDAVEKLKIGNYRLNEEERIEKRKNMSKKYIDNNLSEIGKKGIKRNRKRHEEENQRDFYAYELMKMADSMRAMGKTNEQIYIAVLNELKKIEKGKNEIIPYDGKVAKYSRGEFEL